MIREDDELTPVERVRIQQNRERAQQLRLSQVVSSEQSQSLPIRRTKLNRQVISDGGFIPEDSDAGLTRIDQLYDKDEELSDPEEAFTSGRKRKRPQRRPQIQPANPSHVGVGNRLDENNLPIPPDVEKPQCDSCDRPFDDSFLKKNFDVHVCDRCRDPKGVHSLITKSTAKERYLLSDVDLDVREPKLRFLLKRNPHHSSWGDMRLYLEAQVAELALSIWGSEESLEAERQRRVNRVETLKLKRFNKKIKDLKVQTRSSLFMKTHKSHEHCFDSETYDSEKDEYVQHCKECGYVTSFEKL